MEQVYNHYAPDLVRFLRRGFVYSTGGRPAAFAGYGSSFELEGVLQEVFTRAFDERARLAYDGLRPYSGFIRGVARNIVLDGLRKRARRGEVLVPFQGEGVEVWEREQEERDLPGSLDAQHANELVQRFLADQCDDGERALFEARYRDDLTQQGAADALGLTRIQVRRRESRIKERLLRFLKRARYV
jgi:RNA polymerase sigma-70 factor (ECF subfamily)